MNTDDKIALIDKICELHPSYGTDRGWSEYTGGMKDAGSWYFRKMLDVPVSELKVFLENPKVDEEPLPQWIKDFKRRDGETESECWERFEDTAEMRALLKIN